MKLDNFSAFCTIPFFALFFHVLFKKEFSRKILIPFVAIGGIIAGIIFATPNLIYNQFQMFYQLYLLLGGIYLLFFVLLRASFKQRKGAFLTFIGFLALYGTAINDVLSNMELVNTPFIAPFGLAFYMILQSFMITRKSADAMKSNENLSAELMEEKKNLEDKVEKRMNELTQQNQELISHREKEKEQNWMNEGMAKFNYILQQNQDQLDSLSSEVIKNLVQYVKVECGAIYFINKNDESEADEGYLQLMAAFGCSGKNKGKDRLEIGETMIGSCFQEKERIYLTNVPDNYMPITSGLGATMPKALLLVPMIMEEEALGVIELASIKPLKSMQIDFVEKLAGLLAIKMHHVKTNQKTAELLEQAQLQSEEMEAQEEELRQNLEELRATQEELERVKAEEKEKMDQELSRYEKLNGTLYSILHAMPGQVYLKSAKGDYIFANQAFIDHYELDAVEGKSDTDILTKEEASKVTKEDQKVLESGQKFVYEKIHENGSKRVFEVIKMPFYISHREETGILGINLEITRKLNFAEN